MQRSTSGDPNRAKTRMRNLSLHAALGLLVLVAGRPSHGLAQAEDKGLDLPTITLDTPITGALELADEPLEALVVDAAGDRTAADGFEFVWENSDYISITAQADIPIYLALTDAGGNVLTGDGTDGSQRECEIVYAPRQPGQFRVVVNSFHGEPGTYILELRQAQDSQLQSLSSQLPVDGEIFESREVSGNIDPNDRRFRTYAIHVPEGTEQLTIRAEGGADI
ncbi:MAG: hypothetical protein KC561_00985, partial [Myxococcales bacterium]|nr:hypothetical protein [Myxococcales bacterium]